MSKAKPRQTKPTPPQLAQFKHSSYWDKVPGFHAWFRQNAPIMTNPELSAAVVKEFGPNGVKVFSTSAASSLRIRFGLAMTSESRRRAYDSRVIGRTGLNQAELAEARKTESQTPRESPTEKLDREMLHQQLRRVTAKQTFYEVVGDKIVQAIREIPKLPPVRVPSITIKKGLSEEEAVLVISDVQAGLTTSVQESGGLGAFNTEILLQQIQHLLHSLDGIQRYYPNVRRLHVWFNGDIVEGEDIFGGQLREIDMNLIQQIVFVKEHFARLLHHLSSRYEQVDCTGVIGNHGRIGRKGEHAPLSNFDYLVYQWLKERTASIPNLTWRIPETWWLINEVQGWRFLQVHGDDTGSSYGGIPFYGMTRHKARYREMLKTSGQMKDGPPEDFDYMVLGHHSQAAQFQNVISAGSWPGGTEFSIKRLQMSDIPSVPFFGVHRAHGVSWRRDVQLKTLRDRR